MSWTLVRQVGFIATLLVILSFNSHARLYESPSEAQARYGVPVKEPSVTMLPLLHGTKELRYHHHGWRIRSAYVNNQTVIVSYMKLSRPGKSDSALSNDEIQAILKAEAGGYRWMKIKRGAKITSSTKYQGYFNASSRVWKRGDGAVAWVGGNKALTVISKEGLHYEIYSQRQKGKQRKATLQYF